MVIKKMWKVIKSIVKFLEPPVWSPLRIPRITPPPPLLTVPDDEEMPFIRITPGEVFAKCAEAVRYAEVMEKLINKMLPQERLDKMVGLYWTDLMVHGTTRPVEEYLKETE
jgi:hypothetical protein